MPTTLLADTAAVPAVATDPAAAALAGTSPPTSLAGRAQDHYARALQAQREGNWALYGEEIERLGAVLEELQEGDEN